MRSASLHVMVTFTISVAVGTIGLFMGCSSPTECSCPQGNASVAVSFPCGQLVSVSGALPEGDCGTCAYAFGLPQGSPAEIVVTDPSCRVQLSFSNGESFSKELVFTQGTAYPGGPCGCSQLQPAMSGLTVPLTRVCLGDAGGSDAKDGLTDARRDQAAEAEAKDAVHDGRGSPADARGVGD